MSCPEFSWEKILPKNNYLNQKSPKTEKKKKKLTPFFTRTTFPECALRICLTLFPFAFPFKWCSASIVDVGRGDEEMTSAFCAAIFITALWSSVRNPSFPFDAIPPRRKISLFSLALSVLEIVLAMEAGSISSTSRWACNRKSRIKNWHVGIVASRTVSH